MPLQGILFTGVVIAMIALAVSRSDLAGDLQAVSITDEQQSSKILSLLSQLVKGQKDQQKAMEALTQRQDRLEASINVLMEPGQRKQVSCHSSARILQFLRAAHPIIQPHAVTQQKQVNVSASYATVDLSGQCSLVLDSKGTEMGLAHNVDEDTLLSWSYIPGRSSGLKKKQLERIHHSTTRKNNGTVARVKISGLNVPGSTVIFRFVCEWLDVISYEDVTINVVPKLTPAIDIGTSGICASYVDANRHIQMIDLAGPQHKGHCIPSVVWLCADGINVGFGSWTKSKHCTPVYDVKRQLGSYCELFRLVGLGSYPNLLPACSRRQDDNPSCNLTALRYPCKGNQDRQLEVDAVMGTVARILVSLVKKQLGTTDIDSVAFSFPPEFRASQRAAFYDIMRIAEQALSLHLPEPLAAVAYLLFNSPPTDPRLVLIIDIGHGTTGIQLVHASDVGLRTVSTTGFSDRGGRDMDIFIQAHLSKSDTCSLSMKAAESLKIMISEAKNTKDTISVEPAPLLVEDRNFHLSDLWNVTDFPYCEFINSLNNFTFSRTVTTGVKEFEPVLDSALIAILDLACIELFGGDIPMIFDKILRSEGNIHQKSYMQNTYSNVEQIFIVGGASRTPCLQRIIRKHFEDRSPNATLHFTANTGEDPKAVVSMGAAVQAAKQSNLIPSGHQLLPRSTHNSLRLRDRNYRCHQVIPAQSPMDDLELKPVNVSLSLFKQKDGRKCIDLRFCESGISQSGDKDDLVTDCRYCVPVRFTQNQRLCPEAIPSGYKKHVVAEVRGLVFRNASTSVRLSGLWTASDNSISGDSGRLLSKVFSSDNGHFSQDTLAKLKTLAGNAAGGGKFSCAGLTPIARVTPPKFCDRNFERLLKVAVKCSDKAMGRIVGDLPVEEEESLTILPEEGDISCIAEVALRHPEFTKKGPTALVIVFEQNSKEIVDAVKEALSSFSFQHEDSYIALIPFQRTAVGYLPLTRIDGAGKTLLNTELQKLEVTNKIIMLRESLEESFNLLDQWLSSDIHFSSELPASCRKFSHFKMVFITTGNRDDDPEDDQIEEVWNGYKNKVMKSPLVSTSQIAVQFLSPGAPAEERTSTKALLTPSLCEDCVSYFKEGLSAAAVASHLLADLDEVDNVLAADVELEVRHVSSSAPLISSAFASQASVSLPDSHCYMCKRFGFRSLNGKMLGSTSTAVEFSVPQNITEKSSVVVSLKWRQLSPSLQDSDDVWEIQQQKMNL